MAPDVTYQDFAKLELRVGEVVAAERNEKARKPAYTLTIDFGEWGVKTSSAQLTENYTPEQLIGRQLVAVMNFPPRLVAGVRSEVLVLASVCEERGTILLTPDSRVTVGAKIS